MNPSAVIASTLFIATSTSEMAHKEQELESATARKIKEQLALRAAKVPHIIDCAMPKFFRAARL
jgi:hypothetical protein